MEFYQIGLNKNKIQIFKIINVTLNNYENLKNSLSKYTGRNIKELDILFFWQRKRDDNIFKWSAFKNKEKRRELEELISKRNSDLANYKIVLKILTRDDD